MEQSGGGIRGESERKKRQGGSDRKREKDANKMLHKLRMGDSVLMPSFTKEIAWEGEPLRELGG